MGQASARRRPRRRIRGFGLGLVLAAAALSPAGCSEVEEKKTSTYKPAKLHEVNEELDRVTFTAEGAKRVGLEMDRVRSSGRRKVIPYAALIYSPKGETYVYTSPKPLSYLRAQVNVQRIEGDRVLLSHGPPTGTEVVTVGAAEVYGTELEVGEE